jgi:hypothetical protein
METTSDRLRRRVADPLVRQYRAEPRTSQTARSDGEELDVFRQRHCEHPITPRFRTGGVGPAFVGVLEQDRIRHRDGSKTKNGDAG